MSVRARWVSAIALAIALIGCAAIWPHVITLFARSPLLLQNPDFLTKDLWFSAGNRYLFAAGHHPTPGVQALGFELRRWDLERPGSPPTSRRIFYRCLTEDPHVALHSIHDSVTLPPSSHILPMAISLDGDRIAWSAGGRLYLARIVWDSANSAKSECGDEIREERSVAIVPGRVLVHLAFLNSDLSLLSFDSLGAIERISTREFRSFDPLVQLDIQEGPFSIDSDGSFVSITSGRPDAPIVRLASSAEAGTNRGVIKPDSLSLVLPVTKWEALAGTSNGLLVRIPAPQNPSSVSVDRDFRNASRVCSGPESKAIRWIRRIVRGGHTYYLTAGNASKVYFTDETMAPLQGLINVPWPLRHFAANDSWLAFITDRQLFLSELKFAPRLDEQGKFLVGFFFSFLGMLGFSHQLLQDGKKTGGG